MQATFVNSVLTLGTDLQGLHVLHMQEFLAKEGVTGRLKGGLLPPHNSTQAWGAGLWQYIKKVGVLYMVGGCGGDGVLW